MFMHYLASYLLDVLELDRLPIEMESFENMFFLLMEYNENIFTWLGVVQGR